KKERPVNADGIGMAVRKEQPKDAPAPKDLDELRRLELEELERIERDEKAKHEAAQRDVRTYTPATPAAPAFRSPSDEEESISTRERLRRGANTRTTRTKDDARRSCKLTVSNVLRQDFDRDGGRTLAATKRARDKARKRAMGPK